KSGLAGGVGGERCYQSVSQRFLLNYRLFMSPNKKRLIFLYFNPKYSQLIIFQGTSNLSLI
ncbi:hypothetical protein, partial [Bacillus sp. SRB1LM]|uniref:hypothetical protein n=1 Tax=Bacillus sp. SRB1LM TaxID=2608688 RepID=UPI001E3172AE